MDVKCECKYATLIFLCTHVIHTHTHRCIGRVKEESKINIKRDRERERVLGNEIIHT